jgi:hypothetical protein
MFDMSKGIDDEMEEADVCTNQNDQHKFQKLSIKIPEQINEQTDLSEEISQLSISPLAPYQQQIYSRFFMIKSYTE